MKTTSLFCTVILSTLLSGKAQLTSQTTRAADAERAGYTTVDIGPNFRSLSKLVAIETNRTGVVYRTNSFVLMSAGMNRLQGETWLRRQGWIAVKEKQQTNVSTDSKPFFSQN
jgi:hypothetical protein